MNVGTKQRPYWHTEEEKKMFSSISNDNKNRFNVNSKIVSRFLYLALLLLMGSMLFVEDEYFPPSRALSQAEPSNTALGPTSPTLSDIQLFVPSFPGGFWELNSTSLRTLQFFWPKDELDVVVVLDDTVYEDEASKESMNSQVLSMFKHRSEMKNITTAYNPRSDKALYGKGWHIQQLIMFWADNFTDLPYIGFFDDDTAFTKAVSTVDLFDDQGRPRVIARYPTGIINDDWIRRWYQSHSWAFGGDLSYVNAMTFFPVVIKREHLASVREAILKAHPEFGYFDQFFMEFRKKDEMFSQFGMMFDHIWRHHREEYSWHFEPYGWGVGSNDYPYISPGSPEENGVTEEMRRPIPRISTHVNYMLLDQDATRQENRDGIVSKIMKQGYCFSLPLVSHALNNQTADETCNGYDIWGDMNIKLEWAFEDKSYGLIWPKFFPDRTLEAHQKRVLNNRPHQWDQEELSHLKTLPCEVL